MHLQMRGGANISKPCQHIKGVHYLFIQKDLRNSIYHIVKMHTLVYRESCLTFDFIIKDAKENTSECRPAAAANPQLAAYFF
jgi:hypothetical protein